jgi:hypothetical protein
MSVYKSKKSPYYLFDFEILGRRFHGSTKRINRTEAEQVEKEERERARLSCSQVSPLSPALPNKATTRRKMGTGNPVDIGRPFRDTLRTPKEAAAILRCSLQTLSAHVQSGSLKYVEIGCGKKRPRRMYVDADLMEFIDRQTRTHCPPVQPTESFTNKRRLEARATPQPRPWHSKKF